MHIRADLHIHTRASDGDLSPDQILSLAQYCGLETIAITDHDTLSGAKDALNSAQKNSLQVIAGVELSIAYDPGTLHILGYFSSFPSGFDPLLKRLQTAREVRLPRIIDKLNGLGIEITTSEITEMAEGGQIGRPHIAKVLIKNGSVRDFDEAFSRFLGKGKPAYVEKDRMTSSEAIEAILRFGGLPVLAHPFTLNLVKDNLRAFIGGLARQGLQGIETFYPEHSRAQRKLFLEIAHEFGLIATGGTDYHGSGHNGMTLGASGLDKQGLAIFLERLNQGSKRKTVSHEALF